MMTIYKYQLNVGVNLLSIPQGAELLSVGLLHGHTVVVWVRVDATRPSVTRVVEVVRDAFAHSSGGRYVGTAQCDGTDFAWHVIDRGES